MYKFKFSDLKNPDFNKIGFSNQNIKSIGKEISNWEYILKELFRNLKNTDYYTKTIDSTLFYENLNQYLILIPLM